MGRPAPDSQSSVAEISTIAKEVDKVNQIISSCIGALEGRVRLFQCQRLCPQAAGEAASAALAPPPGRLRPGAPQPGGRPWRSAGQLVQRLRPTAAPPSPLCCTEAKYDEGRHTEAILT